MSPTSLSPPSVCKYDRLIYDPIDRYLSKWLSFIIQSNNRGHSDSLTVILIRNKSYFDHELGNIGVDNRCWWPVLETKCVVGNRRLLVTGLVLLITGIHFFKISIGPHYSKDISVIVTNIEFQSPSLTHQHHHVTNINVTDGFRWQKPDDYLFI